MITLIYVWVGSCKKVCTHYGVPVEFIEHLAGVGSPLPVWGAHGIDSNHQAWYHYLPSHLASPINFY